MKKILSWFLTGMILASLICTSQFVCSGAEIKNFEDFTYYVQKDGTIALKSYAGNDRIVSIPAEIEGRAVSLLNKSLCDKEGVVEVNVPSTVTMISGECFINSKSLKKVKISGDNAYYCDEDGVVFSKDKTELIFYPPERKGKTYTVPKKVKKIGEYAFLNNSRLNKVELYRGLETIEFASFKRCKSLKEISIPKGVKKIDIYAFRGCRNLTTVKIKKGIEKIDIGVFQNCVSLKNIKLSSTIKEIEMEAFYNCKRLKNIKIPDSVNFISQGAFAECRKLENIILSDSLTGISISAFYNCKSLKSISIPDSVQSIAEFALGCYGNDYYMTISFTDKFKTDKDFVIYSNNNKAAKKYAKEYGLVHKSIK